MNRYCVVGGKHKEELGEVWPGLIGRVVSDKKDRWHEEAFCHNLG